MNKKEPFILLRHESTNKYVIAGKWCDVPALRVVLDLGLHTSVNAEYDERTNVTVVTEYVNRKNVTPLMSNSES